MTLMALALATAVQLPAALAAQSPPFNCSGPEYRQFDFWIGEWDVVPNPQTTPTASGPPAAREPLRNVIEKTQGGCVVSETCDDRQGGRGQSFSIFKRVYQQWQQIWVRNNGGLHFYRGRLQNGRLVFVDEVPLGPPAREQGRRTVRRSFEALAPDKVRQFSESLNADGTWSVNYDLVCTRRAGSARTGVKGQER